MDAKANLRTTLPCRHVTEGPEWARHRVCEHAVGLTTAVERHEVGGMSDADQDAPAQNVRPLAKAFGAPFTADTMATHPAPLVLAADVFKRSPCIADLKPAGRDVAKDLFEAGGVPLLMKTLLHDGFLHGDCFGGEEASFAAVKTRQDREGDVLAIRHQGPNGCPGKWEMLATSAALPGQHAITHPGCAREVRSYADI
jgi:Dehydratase family